MIQFIENPEQRYIEIVIDGKIDRAQFNKMASSLQPRLEEWDQIRILERVKNFDGIAPTALWEDLKFGLQNLGKLKKIERFAVVADQKWIKLVTRASSPLMPGEIRWFNTAHLDDARQWLTH